MLNDKKVDLFLKKNNLAVVLCSEWDVTEFARENANAAVKFNSAWGVGTSFAKWETRTVFMEPSLFNTAYLPHELAHVVFEEPPEDMGSESYSWFHAAERNLARRLGLADAWDDFFNYVPIDDRDSGHQYPASHNMPRGKLRKYWRTWMAELREAGMIRGSWLNLRLHGGQRDPELGLGLLESEGLDVTPAFP